VLVIDRRRHLERLAWPFRTFPVIAILGARQVGKNDLKSMAVSVRGSEVTDFLLVELGNVPVNPER
jgi:predicted AAA+ superfamily ATPase